MLHVGRCRDRAIPRSLPDDGGLRRQHASASSTPRARRAFVKFHWKPKLGVALRWCGTRRRSSAARTPTSTAATCWQAIERGQYPEWELAVQLIPRRRTSTSSRSTCSTRPRSWPEELVPLQRIGSWLLDRNPDNFFAETEQVAFCPSPRGPGHRLLQRPAAAGPGCSRTSTPS